MNVVSLTRPRLILGQERVGEFSKFFLKVSLKTGKYTSITTFSYLIAEESSFGRAKHPAQFSFVKTCSPYIILHHQLVAKALILAKELYWILKICKITNTWLYSIPIVKESAQYVPHEIAAANLPHFFVYCLIHLQRDTSVEMTSKHISWLIWRKRSARKIPLFVPVWVSISNFFKA